MKFAPSFFALLLGTASPATAAEPDPCLASLQFIGTHNSYHIAPSAKVQQLINALAPGEADKLACTQRPLQEQLGKLAVRQVELDLYADPAGGVYAKPLAAQQTGEAAAQPAPEMLAPGLKILHSPDIDFQTTVPTFREALQELAAWSTSHPGHEPVMVLLELKDDSFSPRIKPPPFDTEQLKNVEAEILSVLPVARLLTPDGVRGDAPSLREAVTTRGWPALSATAGKFIFALDNEGEIRERYLALSPGKDLRGRLLFASVERDHPAAAWMKRNDPVAQFDEIHSLVAAGFMVRTRADADLQEVRTGDRTRLQKAIASGAQWISTDAPEPLPGFPGYEVSWPGRKVYQISFFRLPLPK